MKYFLSILCLCVVSVGVRDQWVYADDGRKQIKIPGVQLVSTDRISGMDFVYDEKTESIHLVWTQRESLWYARGDKEGGNWSAPIEIGKVSSNGLKILVAPAGLFVLVDPPLRNFVSRDNGRSWKESAVTAHGDRIYPMRLDAAVTGNDLALLYVVREGNTGKLNFLKTNDQGGSSVSCITTFELQTGNAEGKPPDQDSINAIRLVSDGRNLYLLYALNRLRSTERVDKGIKSWGTDFSADLCCCRSNDAGTTWSQPVDVLSAADKKNRHIDDSIDMVLTQTGMSILYHDVHLYITSSRDGSHWSSATELTPWQSSFFSAYYYSKSISAAADNDEVQAVWIDSRYTKTDKSLLKPLGGWPWSDDPDWANNDVFSISISDVMHSTESKHPIDPLRLTSKMSMAEQVKIRAARGRWYVIWSGYPRVGKSVDTYKEPPALFFTAIPRRNQN